MINSNGVTPSPAVELASLPCLDWWVSGMIETRPV